MPFFIQIPYLIWIFFFRLKKSKFEFIQIKYNFATFNLIFYLYYIYYIHFSVLFSQQIKFLFRIFPCLFLWMKNLFSQREKLIIRYSNLEAVFFGLSIWEISFGIWKFINYLFGRALTEENRLIRNWRHWLDWIMITQSMKLDIFWPRRKCVSDYD